MLADPTIILRGGHFKTRTSDQGNFTVTPTKARPMCMVWIRFAVNHIFLIKFGVLDHFPQGLPNPSPIAPQLCMAQERFSTMSAGQNYPTNQQLPGWQVAQGPADLAVHTRGAQGHCSRKI